MKLVDWSQVVPNTRIRVLYSTLSVPDVERSRLNKEVAQLEIPSGWFIDVEWCEDDEVYVVTLFKDEFEDYLVQPSCSSPSEVIETIVDLVHQRSSISASRYDDNFVVSPRDQQPA